MAFIEKDKDEAVLNLLDKENGFSAMVKFDGCVHLDQYYERDWDDADEKEILKNPENHSFYVHICDIDQLIQALEEIKKLAKSHFGEDWY